MAKSIAPAKVAPDDLQKVVAATIQKVDDVVRAQGSKFFPHGITKIAVSVKVAGGALLRTGSVRRPFWRAGRRSETRSRPPAAPRRA